MTSSSSKAPLFLRRRLPLGVASLAVGAAIWLPCLHRSRRRYGRGDERRGRGQGRRGEGAAGASTADGAAADGAAASPCFGFAVCTGGFGVTSGRHDEREANTPWYRMAGMRTTAP